MTYDERPHSASSKAAARLQSTQNLAVVRFWRSACEIARAAAAGSIPVSFWEKVKELEVQAEQAHDNTLVLEKELEGLKTREVTSKAWLHALHRFDELYEHLNRHEK